MICQLTIIWQSTTFQHGSTLYSSETRRPIAVWTIRHVVVNIVEFPIAWRDRHKLSPAKTNAMRLRMTQQPAAGSPLFGRTCAPETRYTRRNPWISSLNYLHLLKVRKTERRHVIRLHKKMSLKFLISAINLQKCEDLLHYPSPRFADILCLWILQAKRT